MVSEFREENDKVRQTWNMNAQFWNTHMGEGNEFFDVLEWPAVELLLRPDKGERLLDIACGNGLTSRRLAAAGARVVAFDFSDEMIRLAKERTCTPEVDYRVLDATDHEALLQLGVGSFDGALCHMAFMDMADLRPLMTALASLLRPGARFVFSIIHPCFNNPSSVQMCELEDRDGALVETYSVKVSRYLTPFTRLGLAMQGQPAPQPYFHRPLGELLGIGFKAGFVLDAIEERSFSPESRGGGSALTWDGRFSEIPPILVCRMKRNLG